MKKLLVFGTMLVGLMTASCGNANCDGNWTYDETQWASDDSRLFSQVVRSWNEFAGHEVLQIKQRTPENAGWCKIMPGKPVQDGEVLAGIFHGSSDGSIEVNTTRLRELAPASEYSRYLYAIFVHEVGHGLGMDHVEGLNNIMYPVQGYTKWGKEDWEECLNKGICTQEGSGPQ